MARYIETDDIVATTFQACLELLMDCARCHDHKFDPIRQKEYYSVAKTFLSGERSSKPYLTEAEKTEWERWRRRHKGSFVQDDRMRTLGLGRFAACKGNMA